MHKTSKFLPDFRTNITQRLREHAESFPDRIGLIFPSQTRQSKTSYTQKTFRELDVQSDAYAYGLQKIGICQGTKTILMVKPGIELYTIVFALFKIGAIPVIVDPGMGIKRMLHCYRTVGAEAFIGIPVAHVIRRLNPNFFSSLKAIVNVGPQYFLGAHRFADLITQEHEEKFSLATIAPDNLMIINFTTGSTGPAKGVEYTYRMADAMLNQIIDLYAQNTNTISLATLPLFGIFDLLIGSTSILPRMDPTKPAKVDPVKILQTIHQFKVSHMFASPAFLHRIAEYGKSHLDQLASLKTVISGGAPVSKAVVEAIDAILPQEACFHITYGSTEALPISSILSKEWLEETRAFSAIGKGSCVGKPVSRGCGQFASLTLRCAFGRRLRCSSHRVPLARHAPRALPSDKSIFPSERFKLSTALRIAVKIIKISNEPFLNYADTLVLPTGDVGEIILSGSLVSQHYYSNQNQNELMKIPAENCVWHRTGDLGWLDTQGRLWFCGRKSDRVITAHNTLYTEQIEGIFNSHFAVYRSALVGVGHKNKQMPMVCIELKEQISPYTKKQIEVELLQIAQQNPLTQNIQNFFFHTSFPVDIRHNAKIDRNKLAHWAQYKLNIQKKLKWLMLIPLAGWIFLLLGIIWPFDIMALKVIWWIDVFLSVVVHGLQLSISLPLGKNAGISKRKTILLTFLFGASWWRALHVQKSFASQPLEKGM